MSEPTPTPWKWYWREEDGEATGGIFSERRPGHAYAVARCPRYQTRKRWEADAALIVESVNELAALRAENERLREALKSIKVADVYGTPYISVIRDSGCWSVAIEDAAGQRMFKEWAEQRRIALSGKIRAGKNPQTADPLQKHDMSKE